MDCVVAFTFRKQFCKTKIKMKAILLSLFYSKPSYLIDCIFMAMVKVVRSASRRTLEVCSMRTIEKWVPQVYGHRNKSVCGVKMGQLDDEKRGLFLCSPFRLSDTTRISRWII